MLRSANDPGKAAAAPCRTKARQHAQPGLLHCSSSPHLCSAAHHAVGISASRLGVGWQPPRIFEQQAGALLLSARRLQLCRKALQRRGGEGHRRHHLPGIERVSNQCM